MAGSADQPASCLMPGCSASELAAGRLKQGPAASKPRDAPPDAVLKAVTDYDPVSMACWQMGSATPYLHIARALAAMDSTTKRLRISDALTNMFRSVLELAPGQQQHLCCFCLDNWRPCQPTLQLQFAV